MRINVVSHMRKHTSYDCEYKQQENIFSLFTIAFFIYSIYLLYVL